MTKWQSRDGLFFSIPDSLVLHCTSVQIPDVVKPENEYSDKRKDVRRGAGGQFAPEFEINVVISLPSSHSPSLSPVFQAYDFYGF